MEFDRKRMDAARHARLSAELRARDVDAVLITSPFNQEYVGISSLWRDDARYRDDPVAALFTADGELYVWAPRSEGMAVSVPVERLELSLPLDDKRGCQQLFDQIRSHVPGLRRIGVDVFTPPMVGGFDGLIPGVQVVDGHEIVLQARNIKTPDEVECIRQAQIVTELAALHARDSMRPGSTQNELSRLIAERAILLGAEAMGLEVVLNPVFSPHSKATIEGQLPFSAASTENLTMREGELILLDLGLTWNGYHSDYGNTWLCSHDPVATPEQKACFQEWMTIMDEVLTRIRPGVTCGELERAASKIQPRHALQHLYLAHGTGLVGHPEMPLIGSDLGIAFDDQFVLKEGMVIVFEPVVWREDQKAAFRAEETIVVTESGYELLGTRNYWPFDAEARS
jgi:Xaa-Pro aminopeptidase